MSYDTETLDLLISSFGWLLGMSCTLIGGSIFAYSLWYAVSAERPSLPLLLGRSAAGGLGVGVFTVGVILLSVATEAFLSYPLGPISGGSTWLGYFAGAHLLTAHLSADWVLLRDHAARTHSRVAQAATVLAGGSVAFWYPMARLLALAVLAVSMGVVAYLLGWVE